MRANPSILLYFFVFFMFATIISLYLSPSFNLSPPYFIFICFFNWVFIASFISSTRIFFLLFIVPSSLPHILCTFLPSFLFTSSSLLSISTSLASFSTYSIFFTYSYLFILFYFPLYFSVYFPLQAFSFLVTSHLVSSPSFSLSLSLTTYLLPILII